MNGAQDKYGDQIDFYFLRADDGGEGQAAFNAYSLRGHPTVLIIKPGGEIVYTGFGVITGEDLYTAIEGVIQEE